MKMDEDLIIPDKSKTLYDGIKAFGASSMKKGDTMAKMYFESIAKHYGVEIKDVPIKKLPKDFLNKILYGTGDENIHHQQVQESLVLHLKELFQLWIEDIEKQNHRE